jgi:CRP-like cAMP-binding protein
MALDALPWIHRIPALAKAEESMLRWAAAQCEVRHYEREKQVVRAGDRCTHVLLVAQGELHLYRRNREAKTQILIAVVEAPATFGDAELYADAPWMVSARSVADSVIVHMPTAVFDRLVSSSAPVAAALYRECCARLLLAVQVMSVHGLQKVRNKVLRLLWDRSHLEDGGRRVAGLSLVELAEALGVTTKTIQRNLRELETAGLVRRDGTTLELLLDANELPWRPVARAKSADWKLPG